MSAEMKLAACNFGQDASESITGYEMGHVGNMRYEINVSQDGLHVFATSKDRRYTPEHIAYLVTLFREILPGSKISVTAERLCYENLPGVIQAAIDGTADLGRLTKQLTKQQTKWSAIRANDYVNESAFDSPAFRPL